MMFSISKAGFSIPILFWGVLALAAATDARAADKFKVTTVECEMFWYSKHTPVLRYDIVDERQDDYNATPPAGYFRQAAARTREFCDRTSNKPQSIFAAPRTIRGIWFQSNDGRFKALFSFDTDAIDNGAVVTNQIGDRFAAEQRHQAQLEAIRTRETREQELKQAKVKAQQEKVDAEHARQAAFFARKDLQMARLGIEVGPANFALAQQLRANPFHYRRLGVAVVPTRFDKMITEKIARFGNELAPIIVSINDPDRFTTSGEVVLLALKVVERGDIERSYGSLPEIVLSAIKEEPIYGAYVGAYSCRTDCTRLFDVPPPS